MFCGNGCAHQFGKFSKKPCRNCGEELHVENWRAENMENQFCNQLCYHKFTRGTNHPNFTNGGIQFGYHMVTRNGKHIRRHREIMSEHFGRPLGRWELVHHINGVKTDNRLLTPKSIMLKDAKT